MQIATIAVEGHSVTVWWPSLRVGHGYEAEQTLGGSDGPVQRDRSAATFSFFVELGWAEAFGRRAVEAKPFHVECSLFGGATALVAAVADRPQGDTRPCFQCGARKSGYQVELDLFEVSR